MHEIFKKLSNRMVGAMMVHTQLDEAPDEATHKKFEKLMMEMR